MKKENRKFQLNLFGKIMLAFCFIILFSCQNEQANKTEKESSDEFRIKTDRIKEFLNDDKLPDIAVDSISFKKDTLETFITDNYNTNIHDLKMDQVISFIFADFSRISSSPINEIKIFYKTPKRKTNKTEYVLVHQMALRELRSSLRIYSNAKFRKITDGILEEHKNNKEDDILETLNFFANAILSEDKKIEFQFFGFDFRIFLINFLVECETENDTYFREATKRLFDRIEKNNLGSKNVFKNIRTLFLEGCNTKTNAELPEISI